MGQFETYYQQEFTDAIFEKTDEWLELAKELQLDNQSSFLDQSKSPCPYPFMNTTMSNVFSTLCPARAELSKYNHTPIPLEGLKQIKFCKNENYFNKIEIWYDNKTPDPICVGYRSKYRLYYYENNESKSTDYIYNSEEEAKNALPEGCKFNFVTSDDKMYIIFRWGDELRGFKELKQMAKDRLVEEYNDKWNSQLKTIKARIENTNELVSQYLSGNKLKWELDQV